MINIGKLEDSSCMIPDLMEFWKVGPVNRLLSKDSSHSKTLLGEDGFSAMCLTVFTVVWVRSSAL